MWSRWGVAGICLFFAVVFLGLAVVKHQRRSADLAPSPERDATARQRIRQFWDLYAQASQNRRSGELHQAAAFYEQALELRPDHEDSLYYLGNCYCELGRYREALQIYQRLVKVNPSGSSRGYMRIGLVAANLDPGAPLDLDQAEHAFRQALQTDQDCGATLNLGELLLLRHQWPAARQTLHDFHADNSTHPAGPYFLGFLCWREQQSEKAEQWFLKALELLKAKKPPVPWSEEGDVKASPELRWKALAEQSVLGDFWFRLRRDLDSDVPTTSIMNQHYRELDEFLTAFVQLPAAK